MTPRFEQQELSVLETTLGNSIEFHGTGLFTNEECRIRLHPAKPRSGIVLRHRGTIIPCTADYLVKETVHTTALGVGGIRFRAIEHLLSALYFCNVINCVIETVSGDELPGDGSGACKEYVEQIRRVGIEDQDLPISGLVVLSDGKFSWGNSVASIAPSLTNDKFPLLKLDVSISFPEPIGEESVDWCSDAASLEYHPEQYTEARGFLRRDLSYMWPNGLDHWTYLHDSIRGLPADKSDLKLMAFEDGRWLVAPRVHNEPAWHKLMDFVGDLALLGTRLCGQITVRKPGHAYNHRLLHWLKGSYDKNMPVTARLD